MIAAILPLLYVERGAQMTFVLQSCLLLVSGVYYSVEVLPEWMQVLSRLSPATYVLDGRPGRADPRHAGHRAAPRRVAADRRRGRAHPVRAVGLRPGRALRQAHRQAQASRVSHDRSLDRSDRPRLGRRVGRGLRAVRGRRPASRPGSSPSTRRPRSCAATCGGDRPAIGVRAGSASTRSPRPTSRPSGTGSRSSPTAADAGPDDPAVIAAVLPRRVGVRAERRRCEPADRRQPRRRAGHRRERRHRVPRRRARRRLQPAPARALPGGRLVERRHTRRSSSTRPTSPDDLEGRLVAVGAVAPGVPVVVLSALTGDHVADLGAAPGGRPDLGRARVVGRRQVDARSTRSSASSARRPARSATTIRAAGTRRPTASCSRCPAARC